MSKPRVIAGWWYCGDICDCSHPYIAQVVPANAHCRFDTHKDVEEGPWKCDAGVEERREQWEWLLAAARRHNVDNLAEIEEEAKGYVKEEKT